LSICQVLVSRDLALLGAGHGGGRIGHGLVSRDGGGLRVRDGLIGILEYGIGLAGGVGQRFCSHAPARGIMSSDSQGGRFRGGSGRQLFARG
jgi:hypothetical protein